MHGEAEVEDIMLKGVVTVGPEFLLTDAAELMIDRHIGALPVMDANRQLIGILTETDILTAFVELTGEPEA
ncbi:MAG: CBS domain-containing protein [Caldilineaceae bacterium]